MAIVALALWISSLILPVFAEAGAGRGNTLSGIEVLVFTIGWGIAAGFGIPWAAMNIGLLVLFGMNIAGRSSRKLAAFFAAAAVLLTIIVLLAARDYPQWNWTGSDILRIGFYAWTAAMLTIAAATSLSCQSGRPV